MSNTPARLITALALMAAAGEAVSASVIVEAMAGPGLSGSGQNRETFTLTNAQLVRLEYAPVTDTQTNETFACASYPSANSHCDGLFGGSLFLSETGFADPVLIRGASTFYRHTSSGVVQSGDDFGCSSRDEGCSVLLQPGTYALTVSTSFSVTGHEGGIPAQAMRSFAGEVVFDPVLDTTSAPEPAASVLLLLGLVAFVAAAIRNRFHRTDSSV